MAEFTIFDYKFNDEELEKEFEEFFITNNMLPMFTNEHRSTPITVSYVEARSVINGGAYAKKLQSIVDDIHSSTNNKKYEEEMFMMLYSSNSLSGMANNTEKIANYIDYIRTDDIEGKREKNKWNIVFYNDDLA